MSESIKTVLGSIAAASESELQSKTQAELETYWHFRWDDSAPLERNLYYFHDMLELYGNFCRRWEEHHNGSSCVVERVRDTYLMPKICEFAERVRSSEHATLLAGNRDLQAHFNALMADMEKLRTAIDRALVHISGGLCYVTAASKHAQLMDAQQALREALK
jgi:hypothetical protein